MINLTAAAAHKLVFGFPELFGNTSHSVLGRGEQHFPRHMPVEYGKVLKREDPNEELFKVFLYPTHCEVWDKSEWDLSSSKRWHTIELMSQYAESHRARMAEDLKAFERFNQIKHAVLKVMPAMQHSPAAALIAFCRAIEKAPPEFFAQFPALFEELAQVSQPDTAVHSD